MRCVETFKTRELASEQSRLLREAGIEAKVFVDPMEGFYPAHSAFENVALMVREPDVSRAIGILRQSQRRAS